MFHILFISLFFLLNRQTRFTFGVRSNFQTFSLVILDLLAKKFSYFAESKHSQENKSDVLVFFVSWFLRESNSDFSQFFFLLLVFCHSIVTPLLFTFVARSSCAWSEINEAKYMSICVCAFNSRQIVSKIWTFEIFQTWKIFLDTRFHLQGSWCTKRMLNPLVFTRRQRRLWCTSHHLSIIIMTKMQPQSACCVCQFSFEKVWMFEFACLKIFVNSF